MTINNQLVILKTERKSLETDIIFIDTSIFENENFFKGYKLLKIAELSKVGTVNAKITEVTYYEVKNRLKENLKKASSSIRKAENLLDNDSKILKNLDEYSHYYPIKKFDIDIVYESLIKKFDDFLKSHKIKIVGLEGAKLKDILKKYFEGEKPFGEGKKKSEFPDAITLDIISNWCKNKSKRAYVLSVDEDITSYACPDDLLITDLDLVTFLELLVKHENNIQLIKELEDKILGSNSQVEKEIRLKYIDDISYEFSTEIGTISNYLDCDIDDIPVIYSVSITEFHIISMNEDNSVVIAEVAADVLFDVTINFWDGESGWYDNEDYKWYGRERISKEMEVTARVKFEVSYNIDFEGPVIYSLDLNQIVGLEIEEFNYEDRYEQY